MRSAEQLHQLAGVLTDPAILFPQKRNAVFSMHDLFTEAGGLNAFQPMHTRGTLLDSGLAIMPVMAAQCAFDIARSAVFLQGIRNGLAHLVSRQTQYPVQVLYAGCGPYATLVLPLVQYFKPEQIQFTLIDIFPESLTSVSNLIQAFGLQAWFRDIILADAITYRWNNPEPLHAVITETMQVTLKRETHVPITANLVPQLAPGGILLPACVEVTAALVHESSRAVSFENNQLVDPEIKKEVLGNVATLSQKTAAGAGKDYTEILHGLSVPVPSVPDLHAYRLELHTRIQVWEDAVLEGYDSGLTVPVLLAGGAELVGKEKMELYYGPAPDRFVMLRLR